MYILFISAKYSKVIVILEIFSMKFLTSIFSVYGHVDKDNKFAKSMHQRKRIPWV